MTHYIFNESGSIPGVPGTFANVRIDIDEAGNITESPLSVHPAFVPSGQEEAVEPPAQEEQPAPSEETPVQHLEALEQEVQQAIAQVEHPEEPTPPTA